MRIDPRIKLGSLGTMGAADAGAVPRDAATRVFRHDERTIRQGIPATVPLARVRAAVPRPGDRLHLSDAWRKNRYTSPLLDLLDPDRRASSQELADARERLDKVLEELARRGLSRHPRTRELAALRDAIGKALDAAREREEREAESRKDGEEGQDPPWLTALAELAGRVLGTHEPRTQRAARKILAARQLLRGTAGKGPEARKAARRQLRQALTLAPDEPTGNALLGHMLLEEGDLEGARTHLQRAMPWRPHDTRLKVALGEIDYRQGRRAAARSRFEEARTLSPEHADPVTWLGVMDLEDGHLRGALRSLERAISLDPRNTVARYYLAQLSYRHNDRLRADYQMGMVRQLDPAADTDRFFSGPLALQQQSDPAGYQAHAWVLPG